MRKSVKDFINVTLTETASDLGIIDPKGEKLIIEDVFKQYGGLKDIPKSSMVRIKDKTNGITLGHLYFNGMYKSTDGRKRYVIHSITRGDKTVYVRTVDWMDYLQPIVEDFKDGADHLTSSDIDWLMVVLRAKIDYSQGLISKDEYAMIINDTEN